MIHRRGTAAILLVGLVLPAVAVADERVDALVRAAMEARAIGKLAEAAELLEEAYALEPAPFIRNNLGRLYEQMGDYWRAFEAFRDVANDPKAESKLRNLDAARMARLQVKLGKAWLKIEVAPRSAEILVDGRPPAIADDEAGVEPGRRAIQLRVPGDDTIVLRWETLPVNRRTILREDLTEAKPDEGWLDLGELGDRPVRINGYRVPEGVEAVRLRQASYRVQVGDQPPRELTIEGGRRMAAPLPIVAAGGAEPAGPGLWPWAVVGTGGAMVVAGAVLHGLAKADRDTIGDAAVDANGIVTGLSSQRAHELARRADAQSVAGTVLLAVGGAAIVGGVLWGLLDRPGGGERVGAQLLIGPHGWVLRGRY